MILTAKQQLGLALAVDRYRKGEKYTIIGGFAGSGKAQPNDTIIPTPSGPQKLGNLKIGDYVYDRQGQPTKIIGVFPQGQKEVYKVTFKDGRSTLCNDEHIFTYYTSKGNLANKTVRQMINSGLSYVSSRQYKFKIPVCSAVEFPEQDYKIDPYIIGAFLGDGCCKQKLLTISSNDEEIVQHIAALMEGEPVYRKSSESNYSWVFYYQEPWQQILKDGRVITRTAYHTDEFFNSFLTELGCKAYEKRIPDIYKYGSIEQRYRLLQGLMDTDGSIAVSGNRYNVKYTSTSKTLIQDILFVLNSLGYEATIVTDNRSDKYTNKVCYNLDINIPNSEKYKLFYLPRKKQLAEQAKAYEKYRDYNKLSITDIKDLGYATDMTCIMVENSEHLYLTNDFLVTHNTTLVKFIIAELANYNIDPEKDVVYATFTGKAAQVLSQKGNKHAMTLHKLLYDSQPLPDGTFRRKPKLVEEKIVVVDEISLVPKYLIDQLMKNRCYVIGLGDPFQLPPISKKDDNHLLDHPHVFLDQIMRQAQESEIIRLTMDIRAGNPISKVSTGKEVHVVSYNDLSIGMLKWANQILVATNKQRREINDILRRERGCTTDLPVAGDKVICCRNYWDLQDNEKNSLVNGTIGYLTDPYQDVNCISTHYTPNRLEVTRSEFISEIGTTFGSIDLDTHMMLTGEKCLNTRTAYLVNQNKKWAHLVPYEFAYGYAITTHRAQGSQWDDVIVLEEGFPFDREEHARWLYTATTRAAKRLILVKK